MKVRERKTTTSLKFFLSLLLPITILISLIALTFTQTFKPQPFPQKIAKSADIYSPTHAPYSSLLDKLEEVNSALQRDSFSATLTRGKGLRTITLDYSKGFIHIPLPALTLTNQEDLDLYILPSDGFYDVNRAILCNFNLKTYPSSNLSTTTKLTAPLHSPTLSRNLTNPNNQNPSRALPPKAECRDFTLSTLSIPALYYKTELYTNIFGLDIYTLDGLIMDIAMYDPGFIKLLKNSISNPSWWALTGITPQQLPSFIDKVTFRASKNSSLGPQECYGITTKPYRSLAQSSELKGWCFIDNRFASSLPGTSPITLPLSFSAPKDFKLPTNVILEPAAQNITPLMADQIQRKGIASSKFILSLKSQPLFTSYL